MEGSRPAVVTTLGLCTETEPRKSQTALLRSLGPGDACGGATLQNLLVGGETGLNADRGRGDLVRAEAQPGFLTKTQVPHCLGHLPFHLPSACQERASERGYWVPRLCVSHRGLALKSIGGGIDL